jgi:hypothetical protein
MQASRSDAGSLLANRYWHGPVVGLPVTQVWQGIGARFWLSFGKVTPSTYALPSGALARPHGELELTNMLSLSDWGLTLKNRILANSDSHYHVCDRRLQRLLGRRLRSVQIDARSQSTVLTFTGELVLMTQAMPGCRESRPHWLLRLSRENWVPVVLNGTSSSWRGKTGMKLA